MCDSAGVQQRKWRKLPECTLYIFNLAHSFCAGQTKYFLYDKEDELPVKKKNY